VDNTSSASQRRADLARAIAAEQLVVAPGVYDGVSARIADASGFAALYLTGYGVSASLLGMPDAGYLTYRDMVDRARQICDRITTPLIADADTGFGGALNVRQTVRGYETAGVAAIQLEDQEFPKRCGHTRGRRVIPMEEMVTKIRVAADSRENADFLIIARTDARSGLGLDEALRRGEAYAKAGADILFIESPESEAEMQQIGSTFDLPVLANMVEGGRTPQLTSEQLQALGFAIAIHPVSSLLAAAQALQTTYAHLQQHGDTRDCPAPFVSFKEMNEVVGFPEVWAFDEHYS
jgi:2-methylisocitrate lyase-like PEP mutase family enzyme